MKTKATVISVTRLLKRAGYIDDSFYTDEGRRRGEAVHALTAQLDRREIALVDIVSPYRPYILSYFAFLDIERPRWDHVERYFASPELDLCGTPDRLGRMRRRYAVGDIKTGAPAPWHGLQLALYLLLTAPTDDWSTCARFGIYLTPTSWRVEEFHNPADRALALRILGGEVPYAETQRAIRC